MTRTAKISEETAQEIRESTATSAELCTRYNISPVTVSNIRNYKGAYRNRLLDAGRPILDGHGVVVGLSPGAIEDAKAPRLRIPAAHDTKDSESN